ncbi:ROK family transcriptional regulator [Saccharopolyspora sp. SCSIO 74807]|uniref:ROK family transcriptional regulator n=1 Tax=Saccharopolyspora sp. SCSIO 74807 TaxID=3118084 RepID=UPI0030CB738C
MTASTTSGRAPAGLRRHNLRTILEQLHLHGPTSRADLCEVTGLTRSAVADLVADLANRGLAAEGEAAGSQSGRGRPPRIVSPSTDRAQVLAVAIEVDTIRISRVGFGGTLLDEEHVPHESEPGAPGRSLAQITELIVDRARRGDGEPLALGIAVAGLVRGADGQVTHAPNLAWRDLDLSAELRRSTELRLPIIVGNEARLAALAEQRRGAGRYCGELVYVSAEVGVGGGIITSDRVLTGHTGYAGEIGHMITDPGGRRCRCGGRGCWETEIGADALLRHAGVHAPANRHAALNDLLARAATDTDASEALRALCTPVAKGLASLANIFNPERIILGGLLSPLLQHARVDLDTALAEFRGPGVPLQLCPAELGERGGLLGAAEAAVDQYLTRFD